MEKILRLRTYVDGSDNDALFPSADEPAEITSFTYNAKRMGDAPSITFTLYHTLCLDNRWNDKVYCWFNGEKYFLKQVPSSSYDNTESRYKHSAEMVSERMELNNVYFFDVVARETEYDKPSSNSTNVVFHGDIHEFASRLNYSLAYSRLDYRVVVDDGVESEDKQLSFDKQFFFSVLQEVYNTYNIPFYFVGKEIHIGHYESELDEVFEYGVDKSLLSVAKNNTNNRIINRSSGLGSSENIPYYYPNKTPYGDINILYNGNVTTDVNITDWARFASCGINGKIEYTQQEYDAPIVELGDINSFKPIEVIGTPFLGTYIYTLKCHMPIKAEGAFNKLHLTWSSPLIANSSISIYDENQVKVFWTFFPPVTGIDLDYGNYTLEINVGVGSYSDKDRAWEHVKENFDIAVSLEQLSCSRLGWVLDGKRNVSLGALGMVQVTAPNIGDTISFKQTAERVPIISNLMPSIYRKMNGEERFYNALNGTYINPETGTYYHFTNPFVEGKRREHIEQFDDIKPTIVGIQNESNEFIDEIIGVEFDDNDNDEKDESGKYLHPYFYVKLRKFDGDNGFNLFAQAIEGGDMTISMTSGACAACQWKIGVDEDTLLNPVQVNEDGSLKRDANGDVIRKGVAQAHQNDTRTNNVWVALMKDDSTFGVLMPNALNNYRPKKGDKFVILNIHLPQAYIEAAEKRLEEAIIKHMYENNDSKFNFSIKFSRIYFAENADVLKALNENVLLKIRYNGQVIPLHVSSFSYKMQHSEALPEISVELSDTLTIHRSVAQQVASAVKSGVNEGLSNLNVPELGHPYFVSKMADDIVGGRKEFTDEVVVDKTLASSDFERNATLGTGWGLYKDANGDSVLEADVLIGRKRLEINELLVNQVEFQKGTMVVSNAGCSIESVEEHDTFYRCFFNTEQDTQGSGFAVGDQARCQRYDATYTNVTKYYWRLVVGVAVGYVDLSKTDKDGDGVPEIGDNLVQLGNRGDANRQNAIFISSYPKPSIIQYSGINSYSLDDKEVTKISPNANKFTGVMKLEAGSTGASELADLPDVVFDAIDNTDFGKDNLLQNSGFTGDYLSVQLKDDSNLEEGSELFSPSLEHWTAANVTTQESEVSSSEVEVVFGNGGILSQSILNNVFEGDNYVVSFKAKGMSMRVVAMGTDNTIELSDEYVRHEIKIIATNNDKGIVFSSDDATMCDVQLERGSVGSEWSPSMYDNKSELEYYNSLEYLRHAIENGSSTFAGGLILSNLILLGDYANKVMKKMTAGISGAYATDNSPAFWAGGSLEEANRTINRFSQANYVPTKEDWNTMAKFVATHGGDLFLRGYIYALGGLFQGTVSIANGKIQLNDDGSGHIANKSYSWNSDGQVTRYFPDTINWLMVDVIGENGTLNFSQGGFVETGNSISETAREFIIPTPPFTPFTFWIRGARYDQGLEIYPDTTIFKDANQVTTRIFYRDNNGKDIRGNAIQFKKTALATKGHISVRWNGSQYIVENEGSLIVGDNDECDVKIYIY